MRDLPCSRRTAALALTVCAILLCGLALVVPGSTLEFGLSGFLMLGMAYQMTDAQLKVTKALPNGAATITSDGLDLGHSTRGDFLAHCEYKVTAPALTTTQLGDTQTIAYTVEHDDNADFSAATTLATLFTQTGAGGAGAAANSSTIRFPIDVKRYVRTKAVKTGASNASTASLTAELLF